MTVKQLDSKDFAELFGADLYDVLIWISRNPYIDVDDVFTDKDIIEYVKDNFDSSIFE